MAAIRTQAVAMGEQVTFAVPEGAEVGAWLRAQEGLYGTTTGATIPAQVEVVWALEVAFVVDLLMKPHRLGWNSGALVVERDPAGDAVVGRVIPRRLFDTGYKVSDPATRRDWNPAAPDEAMSAAEREIDHARATMALAQLSILREVVTTVRAREVAARAASAERAGGWVGPVILAGSVVTAALAFRAYLQHLQAVEVLESAERERVARARIAQAGQDFAERLAQARATGTMPAPSAVETAVAADVQRRAESEWTNFWQGAERTAKGVSKYLLAVLAAGVALKALGK